MPSAPDPDTGTPWAGRLRTAVGVVALLNLAAGAGEVAVALATGSVSLLADAVDFGEDAAVNLLVWLALTFIAADDGARRARWGKVMAGVVLLPALAALVQVVRKAVAPTPPQAAPLMATAAIALLVNAGCALILARFRTGHGSLATGAWLAARNDVLVNAVMIATGALTAWLLVAAPGWAAWPDLVLGLVIIGLNLGAAKEVWEVAESERLGARVLAGEDVGTD